MPKPWEVYGRAQPPLNAPQAPPVQALGAKPPVVPQPRPQQSGGLFEGLDDRTRKLAGMAFLSGGPQAAVRVVSEAMKPVETFQDVQSPFGQGGVGQRSSISNKVVNYRPPVSKYGPPQLDPTLGKYYQVDERTGKRSYTSPLTGMEITTPEGTTIRTGVPVGKGGLSKPTRTKLEQSAINAQEGLARLSGIKESFRPEFQTIGTRWDALKTQWKEKAGIRVDESERGLLKDFSVFKRDSIDNINRYIKEITGAQMSEAEANRLRKGVPDPGDGLLDGDSPTQFQAKMDATFSALRRANVRAVKALELGISPMSIPLNNIKSLQDRGDELFKIYGDKERVKQQLKIEGYM